MRFWDILRLEKGWSVLPCRPGTGRGHLSRGSVRWRKSRNFKKHYVLGHHDKSWMNKGYATKYRILIIDGIGYLPMDIQGANLLTSSSGWLPGGTKKLLPYLPSIRPSPNGTRSRMAVVTPPSWIVFSINIKCESYHLKKWKEFMCPKQQIVNSLFAQGIAWFCYHTPAGKRQNFFGVFLHF